MTKITIYTHIQAPDRVGNSFSELPSLCAVGPPDASCFLLGETWHVERATSASLSYRGCPKPHCPWQTLADCHTSPYKKIRSATVTPAICCTCTSQKGASSQWISSMSTEAFLGIPAKIVCLFTLMILLCVACAEIFFQLHSWPGPVRSAME